VFVIDVLSADGVGRLPEHQQTDFGRGHLGESNLLVQPAPDGIPYRCRDGWELVAGGFLPLSYLLR
jgi:hypothetical protein